MQCLLKYQWVKLPREFLLPRRKGIMSHWTRLASRAAFRSGKAKYCGHINEVTVGSWAGGVVGLKSILGQKSRARTLEIMEELSSLGYISYRLDSETKKLTYKINDWVIKCSGADCDSGTIYTTEGYGFLCLPRDITQRLVDRNHKFDEADAWLDLWCHTVYRDPRNAFSHMAPTVQYGKYGAALTLENLGHRWNWEKTKVWRFLQKHGDAFTLHKLPGSFGCLIFNRLYPSSADIAIPTQADIARILGEIRIQGKNTHLSGSDNDRINRMIAWYSKRLFTDTAPAAILSEDENGRVAVSPPIIRAYLSQCWNCKNCHKDCWVRYIEPDTHSASQQPIRGSCDEYVPRFHFEGGASPCLNRKTTHIKTHPNYYRC